MNQQSFNQELFEFLQSSPTPFHCVENLITKLQNDGFTFLPESSHWNLERGGRYVTTRDNGSLVAFIFGDSDPDQGKLHLVGSHTDSPCLKIKPEPDISRAGYNQVGVEVYGGVLLNPWFDRDLSIAGRLTYLNSNGDIANALINFQQPIAIIPSLAIHLDREANNSRSINAQNHLYPVIGLAGDDSLSLREHLSCQFNKEHENLNLEQILDYDLSFYDCQAPSLIGINGEFIASARLDNLLSCFIGLKALQNSSAGSTTTILACHDHEEVGSMSAGGAQGPFLDTVLHRLFPDRSERSRILSRSLMVSADNAHAVHPNFKEKHDSNHQPVLNGGPVIKFNANQRYATNSETAAMFRSFCHQAEVAVQTMAMRNDMACGSTIGPISASELGVSVVDIGVPQWAMHSIRETAGAKDSFDLYRVLQTFFNS
ncbi:MAG: aspartyl aminopeptidase [Parasphingorhabdus sp.]|jgi:aspartyl aminopeptidase